MKAQDKGTGLTTPQQAPTVTDNKKTAPKRKADAVEPKDELDEDKKAKVLKKETDCDEDAEEDIFA